MNDYKVKAWSWCADYCKKNLWNPHDSYFWSKALLEYRRENNIYEVGDKIVSAFDNIKMFGNSTVEIARFRDDINCIDIIEGTYVRLTNGCDCNLDQFRHATDKEIEQGCRDEAK